MNDFLNVIAERQNPKRRAVNSTMTAVLGHYIPTKYDEIFGTELDFLLDSILIEVGAQPETEGAGEGVRGGRVLAVVGPAGSGKSALVRRMIGSRDEFRKSDDGRCGPLLSVVAPSPSTLGALGNLLLRETGYPSTRTFRETHVWPMVHRQLHEHGVRILVIDETQHTDEIGTVAEARKVANTLKRIMQDSEWPVWLILVGLPQLLRFLQEDSSTRRRVRTVILERLTFPEHCQAVKDIISEIVGVAGTLDVGGLLTDAFVGRLLHGAGRCFGILVEYVQDAIREALLAGDEKLELRHFETVYEARTGALPTENPFVATKWEAIDVAASLYEEELDADGMATGRRLAKSGGRGR